MLFWTIIKVALKSLYASKLRTFLAMLGIIIGVGAVISMLALGTGYQKRSMEQWTAMGTNLLIVRPGNRGTMGVISGTQQNLTLDDSEALRDVPNVHQVAPVVSGNAQVKYFSKNSRVSVIGSSTTYLPIRNFEVEKGRGFTEVEAEQGARVAVLGPTTVETLFGPDDPLDATIKLNGINFRVVGVLKSKGDQGWFNPDDQAIIPYTTGMKQVFGVEKLREIDMQCEDNADINKIQTEATAVLRKRHRLLSSADDDFFIRNQAEILAMAADSSRMITYLLGGIASISLLVGGIGIMNIMLVTVTERTREIGVRKAIGAKERDILGQFLIEAILMSGIGGLLGVAFGMGVAEIISHFTPFSTIVEPLAVFIALGFSAAVGVFFGFYPAQRAAGLDPIVALRYE